MADRNLKIVLVGSGGVGKSSLAHAGIGGSLNRKYFPTLGAEVHPIKFDTEAGLVVECAIWDTAGQEMYTGLEGGYYIAADAFICIYDTTSKLSRKRLFDHYIPIIDKVCPDVPRFIVGNKCDLHAVRVPGDVGMSVKDGTWPSVYVKILAELGYVVVRCRLPFE